MAARSGLRGGVGIGWRRELADSLLLAPHSVDFVEVVAESCFVGRAQRREVLGLADLWPVVPHGIQLSLGSADGIDPARASRLGELLRAVRAPMVSEHVAFTRSGSGREIGHLTALPHSRAAIAVVARNLAQVRRRLPDVPFLLENPAWSLRWPDDEMDEGSFFHELVAATGCRLLLDISNVYANALNSGGDPLTLLRSYPLDQVGMVHLAGGAWRSGFYVDTHAHPTPAAAFALLNELLRVAGPLPVMIERDGNYPPFAALLAELATIRAAQPAGPITAPKIPLPVMAARAIDRHANGQLAAQQERLSQLLTAAVPPAEVAPFSPLAIGHSRSILHHKRVDEALGLLPRLNRLRQQGGEPAAQLHRLALSCIERTTPAAFPAPTDALQIASQAVAQPELSDPATADLLPLRARLTARAAGPAPRWAPFFGRIELPDGSRRWAFKPPGRQARVVPLGRRRPAAVPHSPNREKTT